MRGLGMGMGMSRALQSGPAVVYDINDDTFAADAAWAVNGMTKTGDGPCAFRQTATVDGHNTVHAQDFVAGREYSFSCEYRRPLTGTQKYTYFFFIGSAPGFIIVNNDTGSILASDVVGSPLITVVPGVDTLVVTCTYTSPANKADGSVIVSCYNDSFEASFLGVITEGFNLFSLRLSHLE
jgi:hypothetical protein